jgi:hypothetical protein
VLEYRTLRSLADRNGVKAVSQAGLILAISGHGRAASWGTIGSVVAGVAAIGDGEMFVLALDVDDGNTKTLITVAETERIWPELTTMLPVGLPAIAPFEHWGAALAQKPGVVTLYERLVPAATS